MTSDEEKSRLMAVIEKAAQQIVEHTDCDSVHIFITKHGITDNNTMGADTGLGNFYATQGQLAEWACIQDQYQRNWAIRKDD